MRHVAHKSVGTLLHPIPLGVTFPMPFQSSKLKAQSSNVSFVTFQLKETFELWALGFERAFKNINPLGIGCTFCRWRVTESCHASQISPVTYLNEEYCTQVSGNTTTFCSWRVTESCHICRMHHVTYHPQLSAARLLPLLVSLRLGQLLKRTLHTLKKRPTYPQKEPDTPSKRDWYALQKSNKHPRKETWPPSKRTIHALKSPQLYIWVKKTTFLSPNYIFMSHHLYIWVTNYIYELPTKHMSGHVSGQLHIWVTNFMIESQTTYTWVTDYTCK